MENIQEPQLIEKCDRMWFFRKMQRYDLHGLLKTLTLTKPENYCTRLLSIVTDVISPPEERSASLLESLNPVNENKQTTDASSTFRGGWLQGS